MRAHSSIIAMVLLSIASCTSHEKQILGRWEHVTKPGVEAVFSPDGTLSMLGGKRPYSWADAQHINVTADGLSSFFTGTTSSVLRVAKLTGNELILEEEDGDELRFVRFANREPTAEALDGTWKVKKANKSNRCLSLDDNKRMQIDGLVFKGYELTSYYTDGHQFYSDGSNIPEDAWELRGTMTLHGRRLQGTLKGEHRHATQSSESYGWHRKPPKVLTEDVVASVKCQVELSLNQLVLLDEDGRKTVLLRAVEVPQKVAKNW